MRNSTAFPRVASFPYSQGLRSGRGRREKRQATVNTVLEVMRIMTGRRGRGKVKGEVKEDMVDEEEEGREREVEEER